VLPSAAVAREIEYKSDEAESLAHALGAFGSKSVLITSTNLLSSKTLARRNLVCVLVASSE
jgi:hypothetical protein